MATFSVLSKDVLSGFDKYKYNAVDTSPVSQYIMHPFWNQFVKLYPLWIAPNLLTLTGFLLLVVNFVAMIYYDLDFYASSRDVPELPPVPSWVWLMCAINNFLGHTLDGTDGKQARRTKSSSPLGELFDHGLDSWASFFIPVAFYSVFGRGEYGVDVFRVYLILVSVNFCFIISHFEKYNTGILFLPWGYDISQIGMTIAYFVTYWYGFEVWKFSLFGFTCAEWFEISVWAGFLILTCPISFWNIYKGYREKTGKMLNLPESIRPLVSTIILFTLMIVWAKFSSYRILEKHARLYFWTTGTAFSNIAVSMSTCRNINPLPDNKSLHLSKMKAIAVAYVPNDYGNI